MEAEAFSSHLNVHLSNVLFFHSEVRHLNEMEQHNLGQKKTFRVKM